MESKTDTTVFGAGAKLLSARTERPKKQRSAAAVSGVDVMRHLNEADAVKSSSTFLNKIRSQIIPNCEELIEQGARIRPLIVDNSQIGWVRGLHIAERKLLSRWTFDTSAFVENVLLSCTSLDKEEVRNLTALEVRRLAELIARMGEYDLTLYPYLSAYVTTSSSENLWYARGKDLTSYENRTVSLPDGRHIRIMTPPDHARLWATLCSYREATKKRLDDNFNALLIVQPWAGKSADPLRSQLRTIQKSLQVDAVEPWENIIKISAAEMDVEDGWGHAIQDDTREGMMRELKGFMDGGDKHEQFMNKFYDQQKQEAENEKKRIEALIEKRGGPGIVFSDKMEILTEAQVREREKALKKGRPIPPKPTSTEVVPDRKKQIQKYR